MTKVAVAEDATAQILASEGAIELVDSNGQTIGHVRRPPLETEIERSRSRANRGGKRLSWAEMIAKTREAAHERVKRLRFRSKPLRNF